MKKLSPIGIQFNWIVGKSFPLKNRVGALTTGYLDVDDDHLAIGFSEQGHHDLKNMDHLKLMNIISEALPLSDFSNCYFSFLHPLTSTERSLKRVLSSPSPDGDFLASFPEGALSAEVEDLIRSDYRYAQYNELFLLILKAVGTGPLSVTPGVEFNDKEEWGQPEDDIRVVLEVE